MPGPLSPIQEDFIQRWQKSSASERANYALFLSELCDHLDLPRPEPSQADESLQYLCDRQGRRLTRNSTARQQRTTSTSTNGTASSWKPSRAAIPNWAVLPLHLAAARAQAKNEARHRRPWHPRVGCSHARGPRQAERYAKALPASEGWPPFLIVVDVGHSIELYADFSLTGKAYLPFPDPRTFRILP